MQRGATLRHQIVVSRKLPFLVEARLRRDHNVVLNEADEPLGHECLVVAALRSGRVAGAGLDVFAGEPAFDARFRDLKSVFTLPHLESATVETRVAMGMRALDNLDAVLAGRQLQDKLA